MITERAFRDLIESIRPERGEVKTLHGVAVEITNRGLIRVSSGNAYSTHATCRAAVKECVRLAHQCEQQPLPPHDEGMAADDEGADYLAANRAWRRK